MSEATATCRGCGLKLRGKPYSQGGEAFHPVTGMRCKINHYGGYVCSWECDRRSSLELERSMPGHGAGQTTLGTFSRKSLANNWDRS